jgi:hypothetical protein
VFDQDVYPSGVADQLIPSALPSPAELTEVVRSELAEYLERRDPTLVDPGLAVFDRGDVAAVIPDPRLRAAFAFLTGTAGEPAMEFLLNSDTWAGAPVRFVSESLIEERLGDPAFYAEAHTDPREIVVNERYEHLPWPWWTTAVFIHEPLHTDEAIGGQREEEIVLRTLSMIVHVQILSEVPEMVQPHPLAREEATTVMAVAFNSITPFEGRGPTVLPGATVIATDFYSQGPVSEMGETATPGNRLLVELLPNFGIDVSGTPDFSKELIEQLVIPEMMAFVLTPEQVRRAGEALRLAEFLEPAE